MKKGDPVAPVTVQVPFESTPAEVLSALRYAWTVVVVASKSIGEVVAPWSLSVKVPLVGFALGSFIAALTVYPVIVSFADPEELTFE